ncbi:acyltransferase [uncultured Roseibium sp.]|uniref:acyltransferase family protein n=1 Tax=uncultured Roseibium sp. TaxID=1936171 RepID=UPI00345002F9
MFRSIQILRAIAVIQVIVLHTDLGSISYQHVIIPFFDDYGWLGVRLFFVISGFVITETLCRENSLRNYMLKRYLRVFPLYFIFSAIMVLPMILRGMDHALILRNDYGDVIQLVGIERFLWILKSFFVFPQDAWPVIYVGWSLEHEILFYTIFGILFFSVGSNLSMLLMCLLLAVSYVYDTMIFDHIKLSFPYFIGGIIISHFIRSKERNLEYSMFFLLLSGGAMTVYCLYYAEESKSTAFIYANAILFSTVLYFSVRKENIIPHNSILAWLKRVGDASYSAYIVHVFFLGIVKIGSEKLSFLIKGVGIEPVVFELYKILSIILILQISLLVHKVVERPMSNWLRRIFIQNYLQRSQV